MAALGLSATDQAALVRVQQAIAAEYDEATGFLAGFLEGLGEYIAVMLGDPAPAHAA